MDLTWSMEDVARSTEDDAVRRRFARRNRVCLFLLMLFFMVAGLIQLGESARQTPVDAAVAGLNAVFVAYAIFFMRYTREHPPAVSKHTFTWRAGAWLRTHMHAVALTFVAVEYIFVLYFNRRAA